MAESQNGQSTHSLDEWDYMPATVVGHSRKSRGRTILHTLDPKSETDIVSYDDPSKEAHRLGVEAEESAR